jgi:DEAD/DEAH box helicase domain-containing protein
MLPSILAYELQESVRRFLVTAFEPADGYFSGIVRRFVETPGAVGKGPYLHVGLPFRMGTAGTRFFTAFETAREGFGHQEAAWQRLRSDGAPDNTLVVTGTGSGKTECFLYPVLDHCARARARQERGIKALVIYPMNALANDQARRFAQVIAATPAFQGLRVGLYVGGKGETSQVMTPTSVITDRAALRSAPPDVLLTNYKMLDYLLVRPKDRRLWETNAPDTLRYAIVDELHTFDGAQGTDLALLLRRLRARLKTPANHLVCVGTSATLGDGGDTAPLREYARQVFASPFEPESVITESRDTVAQFLGDEPINHLLQPRDDFPEVLDAQRYRSQTEAIAAWFPVFFASEPRPVDVNDPAWRGALGRLLKQHLLVHNLLRILKGGIGEWTSVRDQLTGPMPAAARPHAARVLDALVALMAWARDPKDPSLPLVTVRVQVWMRELRRLVSTVVRTEPAIDDEGSAAKPAIVSAAELKASMDGIHLPLVQCIECHTTGWLALKPAAATRVDPTLETIYNAWFRSSPDLIRLYPEPSLHIKYRRHLCGRCGKLQDGGKACVDCGSDQLVLAGLVMDAAQSQRGAVVINRHDKTCPACGTEDRLLLLGARSATLGSQLIEQAWATPYNDDKKLIAFSDSVQDAAHRAGFFGSRTYRNNLRMAMARVVDALARPTVPWTTLQDGLAAWLMDKQRPGHLSREEFVAEFIGPNMQWQHAWEKLQADGVLSGTSKLPARVARRLAWEAYAEFTYLSRRGRTIDRLGLATLTVTPEPVDAALGGLRGRLVEEFGLRDVPSANVVRWVWGVLLHLRQRGAIGYPDFEGFARGGNLGSLTFAKGRTDWMPGLGAGTHRPQLLTLGTHKDHEKLLDRGRSWYEHWLTHALGDGALLPKGAAEELYGAAFEALIGAGVLQAYESPQGRVLALVPACLVLDRDTVHLRAPHGTRELTVASAIAERLVGMPCLDAMHDRYTTVGGADEAEAWMARRYREGDIRRVIAAEHTGLLERDVREALEERFKTPQDNAKPWYENLLSATPTLEMGVDIGSLSSLLLCSVPPSQASFLQRVGRAGRRDGNALVTTLADGASPHDLYFYEDPLEMMAGQVTPPGTFLQAPEVLRRQLLAFCLDAWVASGIALTALPDRTKPALDAVEANEQRKFPYTFLDFVQGKQQHLFDQFVALLDYQPRTEAERRNVERVVSRLKAYMFGLDGVESLRVSLLNALQALLKERRVYLERATTLKRDVERVKQQPKDEARDAQLRDLIRERAKVMELAKDISDRDLLNTFTDAGLLPNYAFPEAGVELKSLLWRHRHDDDEPGQGPVVTTTQRFERPAASALSEFAPENRFYANQRRVQIDQINMQLATTEEWRLCPACHHLENLARVGGDLYAACPRCGSAMWADVQQKRTLLRFKQAIANTNDERSRIDDRAEDREPRFFLRQMLVDVAPSAVIVAWKLQDESLAFGFEAIRNAQFRDINFGEMGRPGIAFRVADREANRPGFKLCRHCGMVQTPVKSKPGQPPASTQRHARDCKHHGQDDPSAILDCLYLYREFTSEAVRILVPYTRAGMNETVLQSFMAALQLGLKRHYGGRVDHLRITQQDEPGVNDGPRRQYVLLYDSVPGGTGYLHQLLSEDAQTLTEVLRRAHEALRTCSCAANPEKDGCYRCLYQYRQARALPRVSRRAAEELLGELLKGVSKLEKVSSLSEIQINPLVESFLESQFLDALPRLGKVAGLPRVALTKEIVQGRVGYLLEVGTERYWVRPQVDVGPEQGVVALSRPDFIIESVRTPSGRRPIAVFTDGWHFHKDISRDDARKRSALVASGRYWVWSVVWEDVKAALSEKADLPDDLLAPHARYAPSNPVVAGIRQALGTGSGEFAEHSIVRLLRFLAMPVGAGAEDVALPTWQREAAVVLARLLVNPANGAGEQPAAALAALRKCLPDTVTLPPQVITAHSAQMAGIARAVFAWPRGYNEGKFDSGCGALVLEPEIAADGEQLKRSWREWLALFNELQVLPGTFLVTREGMTHGDYVGLVPARGTGVPVEPTADDHALWEDCIARALSEFEVPLRSLAGRGVPPPDVVGAEVADASGAVVAEAELQWDLPRLLVLAPHQEEGAEAARAAGWRVVMASEVGWEGAVANAISEVGDE